MKLLVGLGNPGPEYQGHRHNIGFMALGEIARRYGFPSFRGRFQGRTSDGLIAGERVLLLMPETFMNRSGQSVGEAARFHKIDPALIIVFHDDLDLAFGKVKIKQGGGHGGHNGLRDLDAHVGPDYWRVRLGIGHPGDKARVHGYVLSDFAKSERADVDQLMDSVAETVPLLLSGKPSDMMTRLSTLMRPPKDDRPKADRKANDPAGPPAPPEKAPDPSTGLAVALKNALLRRGQKPEGTG